MPLKPPAERLFCPRCTRPLEEVKELVVQLGRMKGRTLARSANICRRCKIKIVIHPLPRKFVDARGVHVS